MVGRSTIRSIWGDATKIVMADSGGDIWLSFDRGLTWEEGYNPWGQAFYSAGGIGDTIWLVGDRGHIHYTLDASTDFLRPAIYDLGSSAKRLRRVFVLDDGTAIAVGESASVMHFGPR